MEHICNCQNGGLPQRPATLAQPAPAVWCRAVDTAGVFYVNLRGRYDRGRKIDDEALAGVEGRAHAAYDIGRFDASTSASSSRGRSDPGDQLNTA